MSGTSNILGFKIPNWFLIALVIFLFGTSYGLKVRQNVGDIGESILGDFGLEPDTSQTEDRNDMRVPFYGNLDISINIMDMLAGASASPTSDAYTYHKNKPTSHSVGEAITIAGSTHRMDQRMSGKFWLEIYGGSDFYVPIEYFKASNPMCVSAMWEDYDSDGTDELLAHFDVSQISEPDPNTNPDLVVVMPVLDIDTTSWSDDNPSDITGIGETEVVQTVTWKLSGITAEDAAYITELYFSTNVTKEGEDIKIEEVTLSGGWVQSSGAPLHFSGPVRVENQYYYTYYIYPNDRTDYHNGIRVWRDTNEADTLYVTANVRCTFETNDETEITLNIVTADPSGQADSYTDAVSLNEA